MRDRPGHTWRKHLNRVFWLLFISYTAQILHSPSHYIYPTAAVTLSATHRINLKQMHYFRLKGQVPPHRHLQLLLLIIPASSAQLHWDLGEVTKLHVLVIILLFVSCEGWCRTTQFCKKKYHLVKAVEIPPGLDQWFLQTTRQYKILSVQFSLSAQEKITCAQRPEVPPKISFLRWKGLFCIMNNFTSHTLKLLPVKLLYLRLGFPNSPNICFGIVGWVGHHQKVSVFDKLGMRLEHNSQFCALFKEDI